MMSVLMVPSELHQMHADTPYPAWALIKWPQPACLPAHPRIHLWFQQEFLILKGRILKYPYWGHRDHGINLNRNSLLQVSSAAVCFLSPLFYQGQCFLGDIWNYFWYAKWLCPTFWRGKGTWPITEEMAFWETGADNYDLTSSSS